MIRNKLVYIFLLLSIITSGLLYKDSFSAYFFQDDWFTLRISNAKNVSEVLQFFIPRKDIIYYRPLGMQIPFFILQRIFGINPLPFHILGFGLHAINIILVFILIRLLTKSSPLASLSAFLYGVSAVHYTPAFWPATLPFIIGPTFFFTSFILFLKSLGKKEYTYYFLSIIAFIIGLLTNEMVIVLIPILLAYRFFMDKFKIKKVLPFILVFFIIFIFRFTIFTPPVHGSYQIGLGKDLFINLRAYLLWSFNWPEEMKAQFVSLFGVNKQFIREFPWYFGIFFVTFIINVLFFYIIPITLLIFKKRKQYYSRIMFGIIWFVIGLTPVLFFTQHSFSYYLPISLVGLLLLSTSLFGYLLAIISRLNKFFALILLVVLLSNWMLASMVTVEFNSKIHWVPRRAALSQFLVGKAMQFYPPEKLNSNFIFVRPSSENKLSLNNQDAYRVIYTKRIVTIYRNVFGKIIL